MTASSSERDNFCKTGESRAPRVGGMKNLSPTFHPLRNILLLPVHSGNGRKTDFKSQQIAYWDRNLGIKSANDGKGISISSNINILLSAAKSESTASFFPTVHLRESSCCTLYVFFGNLS
jgi:hypothetical protein